MPPPPCLPLFFICFSFCLYYLLILCFVLFSLSHLFSPTASPQPPPYSYEVLSLLTSHLHPSSLFLSPVNSIDILLFTLCQIRSSFRGFQSERRARVRVSVSSSSTQTCPHCIHQIAQRVYELLVSQLRAQGVSPAVPASQFGKPYCTQRGHKRTRKSTVCYPKRNPSSSRPSRVFTPAVPPNPAAPAGPTVPAGPAIPATPAVPAPPTTPPPDDLWIRVSSHSKMPQP